MGRMNSNKYYLKRKFIITTNSYYVDGWMRTFVVLNLSISSQYAIGQAYDIGNSVSGLLKAMHKQTNNDTRGCMDGYVVHDAWSLGVILKPHQAESPCI